MPFGLVFTLRYGLNGEPLISKTLDVSYLLGPQGMARMARLKLLGTEDKLVATLQRHLDSFDVAKRYNSDEYGPFLYRDDKPINALLVQHLIKCMPYERRKEFLARAKI